MKTLLTALFMMTLANLASAQACWNEWEQNGDWLIRAGKCTENVSIPDTQRLCSSRVKSDELRTAKTCPSTVKDFAKGKVVIEPIEYRCMGQKPPAAGGAANIYHYGLSKDPDSLEVVKNLCVQFGGKWEPAQ